MPNILNVDLDKSTKPWSVYIDETGNDNHVSRGAKAQTITWKLVGDAAQGTFPTNSFKWIQSPPTGVFGSFTPDNANHRATISDTNNSDKTAGSWVYQLTINVGGTNYSTISTLKLGNTDPNIKNN